MNCEGLKERLIMKLQFERRKLSIGATRWFRASVAILLSYCIIPFCLADLYAQQAPPAGPQYAQLDYGQLDQLVAPIALYPDSLVAQILAATTYPSQVVEAHRFLQNNAGQPQPELARIVDAQPWDPSVKSLTAFPSVLANLDRNLDWTTKLGNAYYNQPQDVMGAIQTMRQRAYAAGTLKTTPQEKVVYQPQNIVIQPVSPAVVYVPLYNPWVVYGAPIPVYPAYYYPPPPPVAGVAVAATVGFAAGVAVGAFATYGWGCTNWTTNWYSHTVVYNRGTYVSRSVTVFNHGYYGSYDHSPAAVSYNHQVAIGPNGQVASRTVGRNGSQTNAAVTGPNGNTATRSTSTYPGGNSTTVTGPNGQTANRTVTGRGTGDVTATTTGPNGNSANRSSSFYPGGNSTTVTVPNGQTAN